MMSFRVFPVDHRARSLSLARAKDMKECMYSCARRAITVILQMDGVDGYATSVECLSQCRCVSSRDVDRETKV